MAKRKVKQVDFSKEGSHVAIVTTPANGQEEVTILKNKDVNLKKAEEVKITTSMQTFLRTFFKMWDEDAAELANLLGYEVQEWYWDMVGEDTEVEIMKAAVEDPKENKVHKETYTLLKAARPEFNKLKKAYDLECAEKLEKEKTMPEKDVDLQKAAIAEAVEAALKKAKEENEVELQKAKDELAELKKAAEKKEKEELVEVCKGYSFVEDADVLADSLFLCKGIKGFDTILDTLEKARKAIKASLEKEIGTDEEKVIVDNEDLKKNLDKTAEILKNRKEGK